MKPKIVMLSMFACFVVLVIMSGCASFNTENPTPIIASTTSTFTQSPTITATSTPPPTFTPTPTPTNHPGWMPEGAIARFGMGAYGGMAVSPDNSIVAIAGTSGIHIADPLTGHTVDFLETGMDAYDVAFSPDGQRLFVGLGHEGFAVWIHDTSGSWSEEELFPYACAVQIKTSPDGKILFTKCFSGEKNSKFIAWDLATKKQRYQINYGQPRTSFAMAISPANPDLMAIAADYTITLMDVRGGRTISTYYEPQKNKVLDLDFSPDGSLLAITSESPDVILLNAENLSEVEHIRHTSNVFQLSFIDKETIISFMENSSIVESINGKVLKNLHHLLDVRSTHVYVPEPNIIVMEKNGSITFVSMKTNNIVGEISGFNIYFQSGPEISENGNALVWGNMLSNATNFTDRKYISIDNLCAEADLPRFVDKNGKWIYVFCGKNKLVVGDVETMKVISSYNYPLRFAKNTNGLFALLYPTSSPTIYRAEIWEPIENKKISSFEVNIEEFEIPNQWLTALTLSPNGKYLSILPANGKEFLFYDVDSGELVHTIINKMPHSDEHEYNAHEWRFSKDDAIFFIRYKKIVEAYSVGSGELIGKYNLRDDNFMYDEETTTLISYYQNNSAKRSMLYFDSFDLLSGDKTTSSIELPYKLRNGTKVDREKYMIPQIQYVYLPPGKGGSIAVVLMSLSPVGNYNLNDSTIYVVHIPSNTILRSYTWQYNMQFGARSGSTSAAGNVMLTDHHGVYFLWDISTP